MASYPLLDYKDKLQNLLSVQMLCHTQNTIQFAAKTRSLRPASENFSSSAHTRVTSNKGLVEMATTCTTEERRSQQYASISQAIRHTSEPSASLSSPLLPTPPHPTPTVPWLNPPQPPARRRLSLGAWCANANLCGAELSGWLGGWAAQWKSWAACLIWWKKKKKNRKKWSKKTVSILWLKATALMKKALLFKCWICAPYGDSLWKNSIRPNIALQSIHLRHQARQPVGVYWLECGMCGSGRGAVTLFFFFLLNGLY